MDLPGPQHFVKLLHSITCCFGTSRIFISSMGRYGVAMSPPIDAQDLIYLAATQDDHDVVVMLMTELVMELDPSDEGQRIIGLLPDDTRRALGADAIRLFIAWDDGRPVGLSRADILRHDPIFRLREHTDCGYIDQMYVREAYRNSRVGELLLACCERWLATLGIKYVLLHAAPKAARFYARSGYQPNREMFKELG